MIQSGKTEDPENIMTSLRPLVCGVYASELPVWEMIDPWKRGEIAARGLGPCGFVWGLAGFVGRGRGFTVLADRVNSRAMVYSNEWWACSTLLAHFVVQSTVRYQRMLSGVKSRSIRHVYHRFNGRDDC